jgi:adenylate cyclase
MPVLGQLVPTGGGDTIPLKGAKLVVGRRESCDICLLFPNISGRHCEFKFADGIWTLTDLNSTNGTKVNGARVQQSRALRPGDEVSIGKRKYKIEYELSTAASAKLEEMLASDNNIFKQSLLERAGLENRREEDD